MASRFENNPRLMNVICHPLYYFILVKLGNNLFPNFSRHHLRVPILIHSFLRFESENVINMFLKLRDILSSSTD